MVPDPSFISIIAISTLLIDQFGEVAKQIARYQSREAAYFAVLRDIKIRSQRALTSPEPEKDLSLTLEIVEDQLKKPDNH